MNNYFKVTASKTHGPDTFFPFDAEDEASLMAAWWNAKSAHANLGGTLALYRAVVTLGPWLEVPLVGNGIDGAAAEAFINGSFGDDGSDEYESN